MRGVARDLRRGFGEVKTNAHHVSRIAAVDVAERVDATKTVLGVRGVLLRVVSRFVFAVFDAFVVAFVVVVLVLIGGGVRLGDEDEVVVVELGHGLLAEDELHDVESFAALAAEHRADGARVDILLVAADELRGALLEHQGLEDVEVLRDARERVGHLAKGAAAGRAGVVLAAHAVVVPRQHLLLQPGEVRRLLLRGERHGDGQRGIARRVRFDARRGAAVEVCGGGGARDGGAVDARPDDPRLTLLRRV